MTEPDRSQTDDLDTVHLALEGRVLGHYELVRRIGRGGMGHVYLARNLHLSRQQVAIKVLSPGLLADESARRRFRTEAQTLSKLSHPNIATIFDFDTQDGIDFLVMEHVAGTTLADKLARGPLSQPEILQIGGEICAALEEAHEQGVIHRDLKPQNVMITPKGHVKVLDFGLAKLAETSDPTVSTIALSRSRRVVGTVPYMAPEQLRGENVDARSDVYSLGAVLYEMTSGRRVFVASSQAALIAATLDQDPPPPTRDHADVALALQSLVLKSLDKDPDHRYQTVRELRIDLERLDRSGGISIPTPPWRLRFLLTALGAALGVLLIQRLASHDGAVELGTPILVAVTTGGGPESDSQISPNGRWVSYLADHEGTPAIWLKPTGEGMARVAVAGSETFLSHLWSPDGKSFAYVAMRKDKSLLQIVPAFGGAPERSRVLEPEFFGLRLVRWVDDAIYFELPARGLWRWNMSTDAYTLVLSAAPASGGLRHDFDVCPDQRHTTYVLSSHDQSTVLFQSLEDDHAVPITTSDEYGLQPKLMGKQCEYVVYSSNRSGQIDLWRAGVSDARHHQITFGGSAEFVESVGSDGLMLTYGEETARSDVWILDPRQAPPRATRLTTDTLEDYWPSVSNDLRVAFQRLRPAIDRFSKVFDGEVFTGWLEDDRIVDAKPVARLGGSVQLSHDGSQLALLRSSVAGLELVVLEVESGHSQILEEHVVPPMLYNRPQDWMSHNVAWSSTGALAYVCFDEAGQSIHHAVPTAGAMISTALVHCPAGVGFTDLVPSRDGRHLAYVRRADETDQVYDLDLETHETRVLLEESSPEQIFAVRGWTRQDTHLVVVSGSLDPEYEDSVRVLEVALDGTIRQVADFTGGFPGATRLSPDGLTLCAIRDDMPGSAQNLYEVRLDTGALRRLTDNETTGVTFTTPAFAPDGRWVYSAQESNQDIWLIDFRTPATSNPSERKGP